jgi:hypothetical protein
MAISETDGQCRRWLAAPPAAHRDRPANSILALVAILLRMSELVRNDCLPRCHAACPCKRGKNPPSRQETNPSTRSPCRGTTRTR